MKQNSNSTICLCPKAALEFLVRLMNAATSRRNKIGKVIALCLTVAGADTLPAATATPVGQPQTEIVVRSIAPVQRQWLDATLNQRIRLAEQIGEKGARNWARSKGWQPILESADKVVPQGPDAVYLGRDGVVHVIEAKGGSAKAGFAYGHPQGSPEWAVKSAERIAKCPSSIASERAAANAVLKAAEAGKLEVLTIRTTHILGQPVETIVERTAPCTPQASRMAGSILQEFRPAQSAAAVAKCSGAGSSAGKTAGTVSAGLVKVAGGVAVVGGVMQVHEGVKEFSVGKRLEGGANVAAGTANAAAGGALIVGRVGVGVAAGSAAAVIDGAKDIYIGVQSRDGRRATLGGVKAAAGAAMGIGTATCQPEIVVGAGVVYAGAVAAENWDGICWTAGKVLWLW